MILGTKFGITDEIKRERNRDLCLYNATDWLRQNQSEAERYIHFQKIKKRREKRKDFSECA